MTEWSNLGTVSVRLLADLPSLVPAVGRIRWQEWGRAPEPEDLSWWIDATEREAGRVELPVTFVALDGVGEAIGAVGLGEFDIAECRDRSPWVLGLVVRPDWRGGGVGRRLLTQLAEFATELGHAEVWAATGGPAIGFYQRCGWRKAEQLQLASGDAATLLKRAL